MKKILFPTDFSATANKAFIYALNIADRLDATITTLHVYQRPIVAQNYPGIDTNEVFKDFDLAEFANYRDALPTLKTMAEQQGFSHLNIQHALVEGPHIVSTILNTVEAEAADLIIMGTTGASGLKEIFLGSIAGEVLENATCPVLAVPEDAVFDGNIDKIAFTTTFNDDEKPVLRRVIDFANIFGASVHCINVDLAHTDTYVHRMDQLSTDYAQDANVTFKVLDGTNIQKVIGDFLDEERIDILAMVTHKRTFIQELFHYSKTKMMAYHSDTPVFSFRVS